MTETPKPTASTFDPTEHFMRVKGGAQYLEVKWRVVWLRTEYPDASIETEMVHLDYEHRIAIFRAKVTIPTHGTATGYGSETEKDFPAGWVEKAESKAIGRALAFLGFGTQFAQELESEGNVADSPVAPRAKEPTPIRPVDPVADLRRAVPTIASREEVDQWGAIFNRLLKQRILVAGTPAHDEIFAQLKEKGERYPHPDKKNG